MLRTSGGSIDCEQMKGGGKVLEISDRLLLGLWGSLEAWLGRLRWTVEGRWYVCTGAMSRRSALAWRCATASVGEVMVISA